MTTLKNTPEVSDLIAVRSRVSWAALAAGTMIALAIYIVLTMLGVGLGLEVALRSTGDQLGTGAAIYSILALLVAMFFGGWATSRLAVGESKLEAILYGVILWGVVFIGMIWLLSAGIRTGFNAMVGMASGAYAVARDASTSETASASSSGPIEALRRRYDTDLGGDQFVADLKKAGLSDEQAKTVQAQARSRIEQIKNDPSTLPAVARDMANDPAVRQAATQAAEGARGATWWTLLGMIVSMATVIFGSLVGSGDLLQPVPILGVKRAHSGRV